MNKISSFSVSLVSTATLGAVCCIERVSAPLISVFCVLCPLNAYVCLKTKNCKVNKLVIPLASGLSSAYSLMLASTLVSGLGIVKNDKFLLVLLVSALAAFVISLGSDNACRMSAVSAASISVICLALILALALLDTGFAAPKPVQSGTFPILPLLSFSVLDFFLVRKLASGDDRFALLGALTIPLYFLISIIAAISVLSPTLYAALENPLVTLWSSTYIPSFVNHFETVAVCAVYALVLLKASFSLRGLQYGVKKEFRIILFGIVVLISFLMSVYPILITALAVGFVFLIVYGLFVK